MHLGVRCNQLGQDYTMMKSSRTAGQCRSLDANVLSCVGVSFTIELGLALVQVTRGCIEPMHQRKPLSA